MRRKNLLKLAAVIGIGLLTVTVAACVKPKGDGDAATAKTFLTELYSHYSGDRHDFSPLAKPDDWFDPSLIALMDENAKATPQGDVGALDFDPACGCQDYGSLAATINVVKTDGKTAKVAVVLHDSGEAQSEDISLSYDLIRIGDQWRIHDIGTKDTASLRQFLIDDTRSARQSGADNS